ncbi:hypothetical protein ACFWC5_41215 [Streptomyces sp. NPDC060085]|uniref:hypothetical protein n=1 Tax=Streptomyces sp. NPDC060085 TaxID=3347054 RepID=UPI003663245A
MKFGAPEIFFVQDSCILYIPISRGASLPIDRSGGHPEHLQIAGSPRKKGKMSISVRTTAGLLGAGIALTLPLLNTQSAYADTVKLGCKHQPLASSTFQVEVETCIDDDGGTPAPQRRGVVKLTNNGSGSVWISTLSVSVPKLAGAVNNCAVMTFLEHGQSVTCRTDWSYDFAAQLKKTKAMATVHFIDSGNRFQDGFTSYEV